MKVWTLADIANEVGVRPDLVRQWLSRHKIPEPTGRVGQSPWWAPEDIEPWMKGYKRGAAALERERAKKLDGGV